MTRTCENPDCCRDLRGLKASARYCSPACRTAAYRARRPDSVVTVTKDLFEALRGRVTSHRPISRPLRERHRIT